MIEMSFQLVGGIGLFLLGMTFLTDGLKAYAGHSLRRALVQFTGTPLKAFTSGALATALVQSSSATTVTVIGFVSAGLLTFPQALGVVLGASLGTTGTGWIIALVGLKIRMGLYALPFVGVGALLKLLTRGTTPHLGLALAGFGLIFIGIDTLQDAMSGLSGIFNLARLPSGGWSGHLLGMLVGIVLTLIMQSSSAAAATTLTALHTHAINFDQAASIVIGAAVGTTVTGALAAIGGTVPAKRTALAHIIFNLTSGVIAVALLPVFLKLILLAQEVLGLSPGAMSLAAFHTSFIAVGVLLFLPWVNRFANAIERLLPDRTPSLTRYLDHSVLQTPAVAVEAAHRSLQAIAAETFRFIRFHLAEPGTDQPSTESQLREALERLQDFAARIPGPGTGDPLHRQRIAQLHAMDHLTRLHGRMLPKPSTRTLLTDPRMQTTRDQVRIMLETAETGLRGTAPPSWITEIQQRASALADIRRQERPIIIEEHAGARTAPSHTLDMLDALRWMDRVGYHAWRISAYCDQSSRESQPQAPTITPPVDNGPSLTGP